MSENDIKRNKSGYYDPTAYYAIKNVDREIEHKKKKRKVIKNEK